MSGKLLLKTMVLGTMTFSIYTIGMAAEVQDVNGLDSAQQTIASDTARKEAVRSSWMDRTDVVVGVGMKDSKETHSQHHYVGESSMRHDVLHTVTSKSLKSTEINKLYIETLQPITHYDENAKSVVFVQGRIGRSGEKISSRALNNYWVPARPAGTFITHDKQTDKKESLGMNANIGIGYRRLSKGEHAYVGVNAFYDHVFNDVGYSRTFKNARWARVYADYYNWRGREAVRVGYHKLKKRDAIKGFKVGAEFHITPHLTLDAGYQTASHHLSGPYATLKYTIGTSKFAWHGGKHSENAITTARSKMLDKVHRSDMVVQEVEEETYDHGVVDVGL